MTVIAEFTIPSAEFLLGEVLQETTGAHIEVERVVPLDGRVMPYVWVSGCHFEEFEYSVRRSDHVISLNALDRVDDNVLYSIEWAETAESLMNGFIRARATILEARGNDTWDFRVRFENHQHLSEFHNFCVAHDINYTVNRIYTLDPADTSVNRFDLSAEQRETLVTAVEGGYFDVPRGISTEDIADRFDISQQAASERIRRGAGKVLSAALLDRSASDL